MTSAQVDRLISLYEEVNSTRRHLIEMLESVAEDGRVAGEHRSLRLDGGGEFWSQELLQQAWEQYPQYREYLSADVVRVNKRNYQWAKEAADPNLTDPRWLQFCQLVDSANFGQRKVPRVIVEQ